jgi:hypothetical protein
MYAAELPIDLGGGEAERSTTLTFTRPACNRVHVLGGDRTRAGTPFRACSRRRVAARLTRRASAGSARCRRRPLPPRQTGPASARSGASALRATPLPPPVRHPAFRSKPPWRPRVRSTLPVHAVASGMLPLVQLEAVAKPLVNCGHEFRAMETTSLSSRPAVNAGSAVAARTPTPPCSQTSRGLCSD